MHPPDTRTALILAGGGARAAYQVGVLAAVRELLPDPKRNPFPILCGSSAGAINAAIMAVRAEDFGAGVDFLHEIWANFRAGDVYRAGPMGIGLSGMRWLGALALGGFLRRSPRSFLDNAPLRRLLVRVVQFDRIGQVVANHALHVVSITCSGYNSGQSVTFFQGRADLEPWHLSQRVGAHVRLGVDHLMASCAIPFVFPAVNLNREWFGDGSMRQLAPVSPAIRLGADRIMVIGDGSMAAENEPRPHSDRYPSLAQIAGHALSSIFLDSLSMDLEHMTRINHALSVIPEEVRRQSGLPLRPIDVLVISPSERLDHLAARHVRALPWAMRLLLRGVGAMSRNGSALASYLLFEKPYTRALIDLGYRDTLARKDEVAAFLGASSQSA
ncbi:MAG: patatin-like phospholipase family protein [Rhodocyclaceae bacterium]|nr:patatin-like phospholipase family protein [Rhodocyclaceae bacterium]